MINYDLLPNSSRFFLSESLKNSVTDAYPYSGCSFMNFSTFLYSSVGMLSVVYPLSISHINIIDNINYSCYGYVKNNINLISNLVLSITYDRNGGRKNE